tara:strand:- start:19864 stop:20064 length:201 start_codon:yes stop_codon:yes gene_type:complete
MEFTEFLNIKLEEAALNNWQSHLTEAVANLEKASALAKDDKSLMLAIKDLAKSVRADTDKLKKRAK